MVGRTPKPTHLKELSGNPGKRPLNTNEPKPRGDLRDAPEWFDDEQRASWDYAIEHAPRGLLKKLDRSILAVWVVAEVEFAGAVQERRTVPRVVETPNGALQQHPLIGIISKLGAAMTKAASEMGFTPASRSRIEVDDDDKGDINPFAQLSA